MSDLGEPLYDRAWEPLWAEAEERGIVVCSHKGHGAGTEPPSHGGGIKLAHHATSPFVAAKPIAELVFSGVFERHPRLMWVVAESRIGWLPFLFSWMDRQVQIRGADPTVPLALRPTEYVRRNLRFTFEHDLVGARLLEQGWTMLQDVAMWGCDYPHPQEIWPETDTAAERFFSRLDPDVRHQIVFGRAAELFHIDPPPQTAG